MHKKYNVIIYMKKSAEGGSYFFLALGVGQRFFNIVPREMYWCYKNIAPRELYWYYKNNGNSIKFNIIL